MRCYVKNRTGKRSEIDATVSMAEKLTPDEMREYLHGRFTEDFQIFRRVVSEQKEGYEWLRSQPQIKPLLGKVGVFYGDLTSDGYIKKDLSLFERDRLEEWKWSQSRDEAISFLRELDKTKYKDYQEIFRKWNRVYVNEYETLCKEYLVKPAQKICGRRIENKTRVLNTLSSYREGKHAKLFKSLVPQIRNSIQHQDCIIDPKEPKITFYDRKKVPLTLTLEEYAEIFWECFFLTLAFDIAWFDLRYEIIGIMLEAIKIVDDFFKKQGSRLVPVKEGLSILDWALLIESGKIR